MQSLVDLRWDDLRVMLALVRRGSLKRGAEDLGVNVSTMSRRLDALEEAAGTHLFDRTPEGTKPTAATEQLVVFAEAMEQAAMGFSRGLERLEVEPEGDVRLACPPGVADHFLAPAVGDLCARHPKLRLTILSSIGYADLTRREADLALRTIRPAAGDFVAQRIATQGWCVVASPALAGEIGRLQQTGRARWVTWGEDLAHLVDRRWVDEHVPSERIALVTSSMTSLLEAVRADFGLMLVPTAYRALDGLCEVACAPKLRRSIDALPPSALWLVGHRALRDVPRIAAVWAWLATRFAVAA
jgi:DNA-binding transcriptional LysR family regulator